MFEAQLRNAKLSLSNSCAAPALPLLLPRRQQISNPTTSVQIWTGLRPGSHQHVAIDLRRPECRDVDYNVEGVVQ
jgi:hypothetical protein